MNLFSDAGRTRNLNARLLAAGLACGLTVGLAAATPASAAQNITFDFDGACMACAGNGHATLVVQNYSSGVITAQQFVSFTYTSASGFTFTVKQSDLNLETYSAVLLGQIVPGAQLALTLGDLSGLDNFTSAVDGVWSVSKMSATLDNSSREGGGAGSGSWSPGGSSFITTPNGGDNSQGDDGQGDGSVFTTFSSGADDSFSVEQASVGGVPEPATWGLMLMGFSGLGAMVRARRAATARIQAA